MVDYNSNSSVVSNRSTGWEVNFKIVNTLSIPSCTENLNLVFYVEGAVVEQGRSMNKYPTGPSTFTIWVSGTSSI